MAEHQMSALPWVLRVSICSLTYLGVAAADGGAAAAAPVAAAMPDAAVGAMPSMPMSGGMPMTGASMPGGAPGMPPMGGMPGGMPGAMPGAMPGSVPMTSPSQIKHLMGLSDKTTDIVRGMVQAFLHKNKLEKGELECITTGAGQMAGNFMLLSAHSVMLVQQILGIKSASPIPISVGYAGSSPDYDAQAEQEQNAAANDALSFYYGNENSTASSGAVKAANIVATEGGDAADEAKASHSKRSQGKHQKQEEKEEEDEEESEEGGTAASKLAAQLEQAAAEQAATTEASTTKAKAAAKKTTTTELEEDEEEEDDDGSGGDDEPVTSDEDEEEDGYSYDGPPIARGRLLGEVADAVDGAFGSVQMPEMGGQMPAMPGQMPAMGGQMPAMGGQMPAMGGMPGAAPFEANDPFSQGGMSLGSVAMSASAVFMELGISIQQVVRLSHDILKVCVKDDVRDAIKLASDHMKSVKYVGGRLMANGADVLNELADGVIAFESKKYEDFGSHLGEAMRKVVLSNNTNATLPEGKPGEMVLSNMSAGLIDGFFGEGFTLDMSLPHNPSIHIDLHQCMANNVIFFQSVWSSAMFWFAQKTQEHEDVLKAANATHADEETAEEVLHEQHKKDKAEFGTALALTMMQVPAALRRCNITKEQEEALVDSIKAFGEGLNMHLTMPDEEKAGAKSQAADNLALAVKDWSSHDWYKFGFDLGKVLQEIVTVMFPKKYAVDDSGSLRRLLQASGASSPLFAGARAPRVACSALLVACAALAAAAAALAVSRRSARGASSRRLWSTLGSSLQDLEASALESSCE